MIRSITYRTTYGISMDVIYDFYQKLAALVDPEYIEGLYLQVYVILESLGYNSETLMQALAQPCENLLKKCLWLGREVPCKSLFRIIEAAEGFCCSFNFRALRPDIYKL